MYQAVSRTNWCSVIDRTAFNDAMAPFGSAIRIYDGQGADRGKVMVTGVGHEEGELPERDALSGDPVDFGAVLAEHLPASEIVVLVSSGHDRLREVGGYAKAYDASGNSVKVMLESIYDLAEQQFGRRPSMTAY